MNKVLLTVVSVLCVLYVLPASALALSTDERTGAFAEAFPDGQVAHLKRIAVNHTSGDIYVTDVVNDQISVYRPNATGADLLTTFGSGEVTDPFGIAIDQDTGDVYVSDDNDVVKYTTDGADTPTLTLDGGFTSPGVTGPLAFDQDDNQLLVGDVAADVVRRYSAAGSAGTSFDGSAGVGSPGAFAGLQDLATDSTGDVIVVDSTGNPGDGSGVSRVERFGPTGDWKATIGPVANAAAVGVRPGDDEVVVSGDQNAVYNNINPTLHRFAPDGASLGTIVTDPALLYASVAGIASDDGAAGRLYVATDVGDYMGIPFYGYTSVQVYDHFALVAPTVTDVAAAPSEVGAQLSAKVNPNRSATAYRFEYGKTAAYGNVFPAGPSSIGVGRSPVAVVRTIGGLEPDTAYHFRVVATNIAGTTNGPDQTFTTKSATPPGAEDGGNGRAYEQVSPVDKGTGSVDDGKTFQAAPAGGAIAFPSSSAFAGAGTSMQIGYYIARRGAAGWDTEGIDPPSENIEPNNQIQGAPTLNIAPDLSNAVQFSARSLAPGGVEAGTNLYRRDNLTKTRSLLLGRAPNTLLNNVFVGVGALSSDKPQASADGRHSVFTTDQQLLPEAAPGTTNVYEAVDGDLRLASVLPDGSAEPAGSYISNTVANYHPVSEDGRRIFFQTGGGQGGASGSGRLFMRQDGTTTVPISVSQRPGDPDTVVTARFAGAARDGSIAYFSSDTALTTDAPTGIQYTKLYRYEVASGDLTYMPGSEDHQVVRLSDDGRRVYTQNQASVDTPTVKTWDGDTVQTIGDLFGDGSEYNVAAFEGNVSRNGRYFLVQSRGHMTGFDNSSPNCRFYDEQTVPPVLAGDECTELFLYDAVVDTVVCPSCKNVGAANRPAQAIARLRSVSNYQAHQVLDDGTVYFTTREAMVASDVNGQDDVYEWKDGDVHLISPGTGDVPSTLVEVSADGRDVFFTTSLRLVAQDTDAATDLYTARVGGGIAAQNQVPAPDAAACQNDACQGVPGAKPGSSGPGSDQAGDDSLPAPRARFSVSGLSAGRRRALARGATVTVKVKTNRAGKVTVGVRAKVAGRTRTVASASATAREAQTVLLRFKLSSVARRQLLQSGALRISLTVRMTGARSVATSFTLRHARPTRRAKSAAFALPRGNKGPSDADAPNAIRRGR